MRLLLPALIPSWRFFRAVAPSPRVERRIWRNGRPGPWQPVCPRPDHVSAVQMLGRLFWNPDWNAALYLVTLSERVVEQGSSRAAAEILARASEGFEGVVQIRLVFVSREGGGLAREVLYQSAEPEATG
ncbi:hypothetical protein [Sagittula salina]|uniref:Uncharacterized protein n=1 Tax=Sagittula salina TaxID=2820268 RepID=A0A940MQI2_9RHOB|nr:hypothetical protein [Sagittula salina]MBP0484003.1 hypothetical protein [Sagittula salina]